MSQPQHRASCTEPFPAKLLAIDEQGNLSESEAVAVRDIDDRRVSFYHQKPLLYRRALLVVDDRGEGRIRAELDLTWCRFNRLGW